MLRRESIQFKGGFMAKIYITRHGETEWNIEGRLQGRKDSRLTALGEKQAEWFEKRLNKVQIDIIISSSSGRALRTAEIIRGKRNIDIVPNDNLREIYLGQWEGLFHAEIKEDWPEEQRNFWKYPHLEWCFHARNMFKCSGN